MGVPGGLRLRPPSTGVLVLLAVMTALSCLAWRSGVTVRAGLDDVVVRRQSLMKASFTIMPRVFGAVIACQDDTVGPRDMLREVVRAPRTIPLVAASG